MGQLPVKLQFESEDIYFAELSDHLLPEGLGLGTFQQASGSVNDGSNLALNTDPSNIMINEGSLGSVVRYVRLLTCSIYSNHFKKILKMGLTDTVLEAPKCRAKHVSAK
jgi:hypothetical protein